jgi:hypothetical protein
VELNDIDYETNRRGYLTDKQKKKFRTQYIVYLIIAFVFLACSPAGYFAYRSTGDAGPSIFLSGKFSLRTDSLVESHGGQLEMKFRGKRVHLVLGGKTFTVDLRGIKGLQNGVRYEFFYVDQPPKIVGWRKM